MLSNLKKGALGATAVLVLGTALFGTDFFSYLSTAGGQVRSTVKSKVPVEFEIERAKQLVTKLVPEIRKNTATIASEEVQLERLADQISDLENRMEVAKNEIQTLNTDLEGRPSSMRFCYSGRNYTRQQVETDLASRFERYQVDEASLDQLKKTQEIRTSKLEAAKKELRNYYDQKRNIEVELESLAARKKIIDLAKSTSKYNFDNDSLGKLRQVVDDVKARLETEERVVGAVNTLANEVQLQVTEKDDNRGLTARVSDYFKGKVKSAETAETPVLANN